MADEVKGTANLEAPMLELGSDFFEARVRTRPGFAVPHISAAEHFAELLRAHEAAHEGAPLGPPFDVARWYGAAAILLSFSAIEAGCAEAVDSFDDPALLRSIMYGDFWPNVTKILRSRGANPFDEGGAIYEAADLLRALRNELAHPKAEWGDEDAPSWRRRHENLSKRVVVAGLPLSPFLPDPGTAFPYGCMSAGVAEWAAGTARAFVGELRERCGLSRIT